MNVIVATGEKTLDVTQTTLAEPSDNARARGTVCGYATDETPEGMPLTQRSRSCLCTPIDTARRNGDLGRANSSGYVRVTVEHKKTWEGAVVPEDVRSISVSDRHGTDVKTDQLDKDLRTQSFGSFHHPETLGVNTAQYHGQSNNHVTFPTARIGPLSQVVE